MLPCAWRNAAAGEEVAHTTIRVGQICVERVARAEEEHAVGAKTLPAEDETAAAAGRRVHPELHRESAVASDVEVGAGGSARRIVVAVECKRRRNTPGCERGPSEETEVLAADHFIRGAIARPPCGQTRNVSQHTGSCDTNFRNIRARDLAVAREQLQKVDARRAEGRSRRG